MGDPRTEEDRNGSGAARRLSSPAASSAHCPGASGALGGTILGLLAFALVVPSAWCTPVQDPPVARDVRFAVTAPDERGPLYLAGTFTRWKPGDLRWRLTVEDLDDPTRWTIAVPIEKLGGEPIEFKLTRGDWKTVELLGSGADQPNRVLSVQDLEGVIELTVEAWADDRTGEAASAARESTVTGQLNVFELASERLGNTRPVRVWLPPGYATEEQASRRYPVLYLHDGQNVFDAATSFKGDEWGADESATRLIEAGKIPPLIIVGIDHAGSARTAEYNPPFTHKRGVPHHGDRYLDFLTLKLMPEIEKRYRVALGPQHTALGGSSYGGNITLYAAMRHPDRFGALLVESPVFWAFGPALMKRCTQHETWTQRIFVAIGTQESSDASTQAGYLRGMEALRATFEAQGLLPSRAQLVIEEDAIHHETSWARRLPGALEFLFGNAPDLRPDIGKDR